MAKILMDPSIQSVRGQIGGFVYRQYKWGTVVSKAPDMSKIRPSAAQRSQRAGFKAAAKFYRQVLADPVLKRRYTALSKRTGLPISALTLRDFLKKKPA
jgi:hypothetical protein